MDEERTNPGWRSPFSVALTEDERDLLDAIAAFEGRSRGDVIRRSISMYAEIAGLVPREETNA